MQGQLDLAYQLYFFDGRLSTVIFYLRITLSEGTRQTYNTFTAGSCGRISFFIYIAPVSYTHLDVYKRQGLAADGKTEISEIYHIERGYEKFIEKFAGLGATITKVED